MITILKVFLLVCMLFGIAELFSWIMYRSTLAHHATLAKNHSLPEQDIAMFHKNAWLHRRVGLISRICILVIIFLLYPILHYSSIYRVTKNDTALYILSCFIGFILGWFLYGLVRFLLLRAAREGIKEHEPND
jgi:hypothetical protein